MVKKAKKQLLKVYLFGPLLTWGCLLLLIIVLGLFVSIPGINEPLSTAMESYHIEDLYSYWQRNTIPASVQSTCSDLVVVDVSSLKKRSDLASLIDTLNHYQPKSILLDVIFAPLAMADSSQDRALVGALQRVSNLVVAAHWSEDSTLEEHSFFIPEVQATEGELAFEGGVIRSYQSFVQVRDSSYPSLSSLIAQQLGVEPPFSTQPQHICFSHYPVMVVQPNQPFCWQYIQNKVVVIGDIKDKRDYHSVPALAAPNGSMSGTLIHVQAALSGIVGKPVRTLPTWLMYVLDMLLLLVFSLILNVIPFSPMSNWVQTLVQICLIVLIIPVGYWIYESQHVVIPLTYFLVGCTLIGFAKDLSDLIVLKLKK